jgi:tRNA A-37 threonylcarbamoyl transferase component Bud32/membrane-associated phospholipid phosphatase
MTPSGRTCPSCAAELASGVRYCSVCGAAASAEVLAGVDSAPTQLLPQQNDLPLEHRIQQAVGNGFRVGRLLGQGGFGSVYAAQDVKLEREVAIKVLRPDALGSREFVERFLREARTIAQLRHTGIVPVYQVGDAEGLVWFVMPLVKGESLRALLVQQGRVPVPEARRILAETARALAAAHEAGVIHRDVKPENIMLEGWERRVQLMDFGISRSLHAGSEAGLTEAGMIIGTVDYMSPEQASGAPPVDHRTDIYSLGVIAYEMLAGRSPFAADTPREVLTRHMVAEPPPLAEARPDVPADLAAAIMRCLRKNRAERWASAHELALALEGSPATAAPAPVPGPAGAAGAAVPAPVTGPPATAGTAAALPTAGADAVGPTVRKGVRMLSGRMGLTLVLAAAAAVNWIQTTADNWIGARSATLTELRHQVAHAMGWLEGYVSFAGHDATNALALYGYTAVYFFVFPALWIAIAVALARRPTVGPYRLLVTATVVDYAASLPFYLFLPAPERWAFPESGAVLLPDRWSSHLIEMVRPMSGLDNCFPSSHVSLTVVCVLTAFICQVRFRWPALAIGLTVICSTFVLGIHWVADIVAGVCVAILSTTIALRLGLRAHTLQRAPVPGGAASPGVARAAGLLVPRGIP